MRQWDVFDFDFAHPVGRHPAIVLSPDEVASNPDALLVNVLIITTVRVGYTPGRFDILLNGADGLDHLSKAKLQPIVAAKKSDAGRKWGTLSYTRQKAVAQKIREIYRLG